MDRLDTAITPYTRAITAIERNVAALNLVLGVLDGPRNKQATFGYIGDLTARYDDRSWYVFLPHPGRPGTSDDRIGGFATDDVEGAVACLLALQGAIKMAKALRR